MPYVKVQPKIAHGRGRLHVPYASALKHMVDGVDDIVVHRIHAVPVIPFLSRLTHGIEPQVGLGINLSIHLVIGTSPFPYFHLVVGII